MECMDRFRCHVQYDGWGCCIKSYRFAIAQPWHYVEAYHSDPNLCCVHNETVNAQGEIVTIFERPIPSTRPVGNRRCPPEALSNANMSGSGKQVQRLMPCTFCMTHEVLCDACPGITDSVRSFPCLFRMRNCLSACSKVESFIGNHATQIFA